MTRSGLVVLAGGLGIRMEGALEGMPKALAPVMNGRSLLELVVAHAVKSSTPVMVVTDTRSEPRLRQSIRSAHVLWVIDEGVGTGKAISRVLEQGGLERYIVMNGDTLVPFNVFDILRSEMPATPIRQHLTRRSSQNEGLIGLDVAANEVVHWGEGALRIPPTGTLERTSSSGVYEITRGARPYFEKNLTSLEEELIPSQVDMGQVAAVLHDTGRPTYDYGTKFRYRQLHDNLILRRKLLIDMGVLW